jgi:hypothetical protein
MPRSLVEEYPELMHYTSAGGLAGILSSHSLWATHSAFLNDASEIRHFFDARLLELALPEVRKFADEFARNPAHARQMEADGGIEQIARIEAEALVSRLRMATLDVNQSHIFSMSATHDLRAKQSGLLSQWRGYGSDGGYAIVLDTAKTEERFKEEATSHYYQYAQMGDVFYHGVEDAVQPSSEEVAQYEEEARTAIAILIRGGTSEDVESFYHPITSLSCFYKHWGFWEEREVRIVLTPVDREVGNAAGDSLPIKKIKTFLRNGMPVPYIELFAKVSDYSTQRRLPIKRIIVGPHRDSMARKGAVQILLATNGYQADVEVSQIPYIGH